MLKHGVSGLPVVDGAGKLVGILSKGDFLRRAGIGTERKRGRLLTFLAGPDKVAFELDSPVRSFNSGRLRGWGQDSVGRTTSSITIERLDVFT